MLLIMEPSRQPLESFSLYIWGHLPCLDCCSGSTSPSLICLCRIERQPYQGCVTSPPVCSIEQHVFTHPFLVLIANVAHSWGVASCQNSARIFMTKLHCCHLRRLYTQEKYRSLYFSVSSPEVRIVSLPGWSNPSICYLFLKDLSSFPGHSLYPLKFKYQSWPQPLIHRFEACGLLTLLLPFQHIYIDSQEPGGIYQLVPCF